MLAILTALSLNIIGNPEQYDCLPAYGTQDKCLVFSGGYPDFLVTFECEGSYPTWRDELLVFYPDAKVVKQSARHYLCTAVKIDILSRPEARNLQFGNIGNP